jgi:hypothetical protein
MQLQTGHHITSHTTSHFRAAGTIAVCALAITTAQGAVPSKPAPKTPRRTPEAQLWRTASARQAMQAPPAGPVPSALPGALQPAVVQKPALPAHKEPFQLSMARPQPTLAPRAVRGRTRVSKERLGVLHARPARCTQPPSRGAAVSPTARASRATRALAVSSARRAKRGRTRAVTAQQAAMRALQTRSL